MVAPLEARLADGGSKGQQGRVGRGGRTQPSRWQDISYARVIFRVYVLGPLEARLADAAKGGKDALVVADVRSLPAGKTSDMLGLYSGFTWWPPWRRGSRMQQRAARTRWSWRTYAAFPLARHQLC